MPKGVGGESGVWKYLWALPQAQAWEELALVRTVARYAVALVEAERVGSSAYLLSEVRQLEDRLGLNPLAMKRLQWEVKAEGVPVEDPDTGQPVRSLEAYRERAK